MRRISVAMGGMMGVGKSTVGRRVARRLGLPFIDTDRYLEQRFGPIAAQLVADPELFRDREAAVVAEVAAQSAVIATGGGAWARAESRAVLRQHAETVVLHAPPSVLRARVGTGVGRPLADRLERLLEERRAAYADADHAVDADAPVDEVVERVLRAVDPVHVTAVGGPGSSYEVCLARSYHGLPTAMERAGLAGRAVVVVSDSRVAPLWMQTARTALESVAGSVREVVIEAGERQKDASSWLEIVDGLLSGPLDRGTIVVALGGGVVGDLAGFAAASVLRGVPWVLLPTTLLSMVDSSVGGKTGFNHRSGKNLIGAFHQPRLVYAALDTLTTLPAREVAAGLGEVVKAALIDDPDLLELLESTAPAIRAGDPRLLARVVRRSIMVKSGIVQADALEHGVRRVLNLGHTVAHGLETALGYGVLLHGEAVALGLQAETNWAVREGLCVDRRLPQRLTAVCDALGLPTVRPPVDSDVVVAAMRLDKKGHGDNLRVPVPVRVGEVVQALLPLDRVGELLGTP